MDGASSRGIWERLVEPHPSEKDLHFRRILRLVASWHFVTIPLGPMLAGFQILAGEGHRVRALWLFIAPVMTAINFALTRSRFGRKALKLQVASTFALVGAAIVISPDRSSTVTALILPTLAAALCFGLKEVLFTQVLSIAYVTVNVLLAEPGMRGNWIGSGIVLLSAFAIIAAITRHRVWLHNANVRQLKQEVERARTILEAGFDGIADVVEGKLYHVTEGFGRALGRKPEELEGQSFEQVFPGQISSHKGRQEAVPVLDSDGSLRYLTLIRQMLQDSTEGVEVIAVRDDTHEQMHKANLQFTDRLASLGTVAAGVAHEVNNALTSLVGHSEVGAMSVLSKDLDQSRASFEAITTSAQRIASCVSELQRFGGRRDDKPEIVDVSDVVHSTLRLARHQVKHLTALEVDCPEDGPKAYIVDSWLGQIIMNLVLNAVDAVSETHEPRVIVLVRDDGDWAHIEVSDNGPGVPADLQKQIFQPFFSTKDGKGSGLGLSISASIATRMGGRLSYEPSEKGARFVLKLPKKDSAAVAPETPGYSFELSSEHRIIVVDDEEEVLSVIARLLAPARVDIAKSVDEAIPMLGSRFDLVLSDLIIPEKNGLILRDWLVRNQPKEIAKFVLMTGSALGLGEILNDLPESQIVLRKPVLRADLFKIIEKLFRA